MLVTDNCTDVIIGNIQSHDTNMLLLFSNDEVPSFDGNFSDVSVEILRPSQKR